jgi:hypothetical protein
MFNVDREDCVVHNPKSVQFGVPDRHLKLEWLRHTAFITEGESFSIPFSSWQRGRSNRTKRNAQGMFRFSGGYVCLMSKKKMLLLVQLYP